ncbi:GntR family transcriptional regulator [Yersinia pseudotuberculosis]|uniref:GntR family transcriptional regulator n=1 Tax=Yersinia pseudotuberculosis TaxID=633 RepID=UPI0005DC484F|nr:GntR family transcriptional regulator [Yersinia pseudotuberculosis]CND31212.1 GntR family transcriptional regulator [Yersinia pseudotuberculosis]
MLGGMGGKGVDRKFIETLKTYCDDANRGGGPLYQRLEKGFRDLITRGELKAGYAIPSERELSERLNLSRVTVRRALSEMANAQVIVQRRGARSTVAGRVEKPLSSLTSFSEDMISRGYEPGARWLQKELTHASPSEIIALNLSPGALVWRLKRLRTVDEHPMAVEIAVVPQMFIPEMDELRDSLYSVLQLHGFMPARALQRIRAEPLSRDHSQLLDMPAHSPALHVERHCYLEDGRPIEYTHTWYRGDSYDFLVELQRDITPGL